MRFEKFIVPGSVDLHRPSLRAELTDRRGPAPENVEFYLIFVFMHGNSNPEPILLVCKTCMGLKQLSHLEPSILYNYNIFSLLTLFCNCYIHMHIIFVLFPPPSHQI